MSLEIDDSWNADTAEFEALGLIIQNIKENGTERVHDPYCSPCIFSGSTLCPNTCEIAKIDPEDLRPWQDYLEIKSRMDKKKILNAGYSKKTPIQNIPKSYFFITLNPKSTIEFKDFHKKVLKTLQSTLFTEYLAVFEQRGTVAENNLGKGFHSHILFKRKTPLGEGLPPSNIEAKIRKSYINFVGDHSSPRLINFQTVDERHAIEKAKYMLGPKWDDKLEKQDGDYIWTKSLNIPPHYISDPFVDYLCKKDTFFDDYL